MADNENGRPGKGGPMLSTAIKCDVSLPPRCLLCGHPITCERSIRAGIGTECRRRIRRLAQAMTA